MQHSIINISKQDMKVLVNDGEKLPRIEHGTIMMSNKLIELCTCIYNIHSNIYANC